MNRLVELLSQHDPRDPRARALCDEQTLSAMLNASMRHRVLTARAGRFGCGAGLLPVLWCGGLSRLSCSVRPQPANWLVGPRPSDSDRN